MDDDDDKSKSSVTDKFSVIVLTYNEERNIRACLESLQPLNVAIFIVDSGSTDKTLEICSEYTANIFHHPFENYSVQRNWAFNNLPITTGWVLNLDADHRATPELATELTATFNQPIDTDINGFLVSRRTMFMDKWIKHGGHYPTYHAILFRKGFGQCENKLYDQHFKITGKTKILKGDMIDIITESLNTFIARHNHWATLEAEYLISTANDDTVNGEVIKAKLTGNPIERRRYIKKQYESFPLFVRPIVYFIIRYFIRLGFLDGTEGLIFHFLQGFWFRFLIDAKIYEKRKKAGKASGSNQIIKFIFSFIFLFLVFYFFNIMFFGLTSQGNHYSPFLAEHLNYIQGLRSLLLSTSASILNMLGFTAITSNTEMLVVGHQAIQVVYSCLGLGIISFFTAFVLAYPKPLKKKLIFIAAGIFIIELLNVIRFVLLGLYWNKNAAKTIDHHTLFNIFIYIIIAISLYFWIKNPVTENKEHAAN
ncbi:exosortase/archaeosortase family protein [Mucilaginibacter mallensis]|uniref:Exosortase/archaeosortase family protein n=1 Tax=Mucilaginibacter mallensis TaxID=652787 RepID=A0A1H2B4Z9_MUCMA|nr:glycosyltransferase [Mucilaginibacter mallensis]SDT53281.1 exosortase/archaeosortase family protein [Mucilaginibacter mallensis]